MRDRTKGYTHFFEAELFYPDLRVTKPTLNAPTVNLTCLRVSKCLTILVA